MPFRLLAKIRENSARADKFYQVLSCVPYTYRYPAIARTLSVSLGMNVEFQINRYAIAITRISRKREKVQGALLRL